jgi:hypothetical protein
MRSPRAWIFDGGLTVWIPVLMNLYTEYIVFTMACLCYIRAIMAFMHVSLVELLRQAMMGRVPALESMMSGAWATMTMTHHASCRFPRLWGGWCLSDVESPHACLTGVPGLAPRVKEEGRTGRQVVKFCSSVPIVGRRSKCTVCSQD